MNRIARFARFGMALLCLSVLGLTKSLASYDPPKLDWTALDVDALSLTPGQRTEISGALGALASNFPGDATIDTDLCEKALAVALLLDPYEGTARLAHESLSQGKAPPIAAGYGTRNFVAGVLWSHAVRLTDPSAEPEDHKLATLLMEVALVAFIKPETSQITLYEWEAKRFPAVWERFVVVSSTRAESDRRLEALRRLVESMPTAPVPPRNPEVGPAPAPTVQVASAAPVTVPPTPANTPPKPVMTPEPPPPAPPSLPPPDRPQPGAMEAKPVREPLAGASLKLVTLRLGNDGQPKPELVTLSLQPQDPASKEPAQEFPDPEPRVYGIFFTSPGRRIFSAREMTITNEALGQRWKLPVDGRFRVLAARTFPDKPPPVPDPSAFAAEPGGVRGNYLPIAAGLLTAAEAAFQGVELDATALLAAGFDEEFGWRPLDPVRPSQILGQAISSDSRTVVMASSATQRDMLMQMLAAGRVDEVLAMQLLTASSPQEAVRCLAASRAPELTQALGLFRDIQDLRARMTGEDIVKNIKVRERLEQVLGLAPNHLTADLLLAYGKAPPANGVALGLEPSRTQLSDVLRPLEDALLTETAAPGTIKEPQGLAIVNNAYGSLRLMRGRLAPETVELQRSADSALKTAEIFFRMKNRDTSLASQKRGEAIQFMNGVINAAR